MSQGLMLIVGLGNPGAKYAKTRHNVGFVAVEELARECGASFTPKKAFKAQIATALLGERKAVLVKPETYMNLSGESVAQVKRYYGVPSENIVVVVDDIYLPVGQVRFREKGSAAGHNGLKSIEQHLKSQEYARLRIGVGQPEGEQDLADYVLDTIRKDEEELIEKAIKESVDLLTRYATEQSQNELQ